MGEVATGLQPKWPSNNPLQKLVDELWKQIVACWNQEQNGPPTVFKVLQTLRVLGETQHQEPAVPVENFEVESIVRELDHVNNDPEESTFLDLLWGPKV